jgi:hypothetical protein
MKKLIVLLIISINAFWTFAQDTILIGNLPALNNLSSGSLFIVEDSATTKKFLSDSLFALVADTADMIREELADTADILRTEMGGIWTLSDDSIYPTTAIKLVPTGIINIGSQYNKFNLFYGDSIHANWFGGSDFTFGTNTDTATFNGYVGIKKTNPGYDLEVVGGIYADTITSKVDILSGRYLGFNGDLDSYISNPAADEMLFTTGGASFLKFDENTGDSIIFYKDLKPSGTVDLGSRYNEFSRGYFDTIKSAIFIPELSNPANNYVYGWKNDTTLTMITGAQNPWELYSGYDVGELKPAYRFRSDDNSGMGQDGTDRLCLTVGGERFIDMYEEGTADSITILKNIMPSGTVDLGSQYNAFDDVWGKLRYTDNLMIGLDAGTDVAAGADSNIFIGQSAGANTTTGKQNIFIGVNSGYANTTGINTISIGSQAGRLATSSNSIFTGTDAGEHVTSNYNVMIGYAAGDVATTAEYNTFVGANAGGANTTADYNTFIGYNAGASITDGHYNTIIGHTAGASMGTSGTCNTFLGDAAGFGSDANYNTGIGRATLYTDNQGYNTAIGFESGFKLTDQNCTLVGYYAGHLATSAQHTTILGNEAGDSLTTGDYNTFLGSEAGGQVTTGASNVLIGFRVGSLSGNLSNTLMIDNSNTISPLIWANFSTDSVSIHGSLEADDIFASGGCCADFVFSPDYKLIPWRDQVRYFRKNYSLPALTMDKGKVVNLQQRMEATVEELEKAYLYIEQLEKRMTELEDKVQKIIIVTKY